MGSPVLRMIPLGLEKGCRVFLYQDYQKNTGKKQRNRGCRSGERGKIRSISCSCAPGTGSGSSCAGDKNNTLPLHPRGIHFFLQRDSLPAGILHAGSGPACALRRYVSSLPGYALRSRERVTTVTELAAMARAASSGLKVMPKPRIQHSRGNRDERRVVGKRPEDISPDPPHHLPRQLDRGTRHPRDRPGSGQCPRSRSPHPSRSRSRCPRPPGRARGHR